MYYRHRRCRRCGSAHRQAVSSHGAAARPPPHGPSARHRSAAWPLPSPCWYPPLPPPAAPQPQQHGREMRPDTAPLGRPSAAHRRRPPPPAAARPLWRRLYSRLAAVPPTAGPATRRRRTVDDELRVLHAAALRLGQRRHRVERPAPVRPVRRQLRGFMGTAERSAETSAAPPDSHRQRELAHVPRLTKLLPRPALRHRPASAARPAPTGPAAPRLSRPPGAHAGTMLGITAGGHRGRPGPASPARAAAARTHPPNLWRPRPLCKQAAPSAHAAPVTHCVCARPLPLGHGGLADLGGQ
jgi:hypothetical protein